MPGFQLQAKLRYLDIYKLSGDMGRCFPDSLHIEADRRSSTVLTVASSTTYTSALFHLVCDKVLYVTELVGLSSSFLFFYKHRVQRLSVQECLLYFSSLHCVRASIASYEAPAQHQYITDTVFYRKLHLL